MNLKELNDLIGFVTTFCDVIIIEQFNDHYLLSKKGTLSDTIEKMLSSSDIQLRMNGAALRSSEKLYYAINGFIKHFFNEKDLVRKRELLEYIELVSSGFCDDSICDDIIPVEEIDNDEVESETMEELK